METLDEQWQFAGPVLDDAFTEPGQHQIYSSLITDYSSMIYHSGGGFPYLS